MTTNPTLSIWHRRTPSLLIPIVLIGSLAEFSQKTVGVLEITVNSKPIGATKWTGVDTAGPTVEKAWAPTYQPSGHRVIVARATKASPQIKVMLDQPVRTISNRHIVVSIPDKKLYLMENGRLIRRYSAMVGDKNEPTPIGEFRIIEHVLWNDTVIGKAWMGFHDNPKKDAYYGIHGLGPQHDETSTSGCVALKNDDVVDLFRRVSKGDPVSIIGTRGPFDSDYHQDASWPALRFVAKADKVRCSGREGP